MPAASRAAWESHPVTPERWGDLLALFEPANGVCGGCWCMYWRLPRAAWSAGLGDENRDALRALVGAGDAPGLLGYVGGEPVAWASVGPREAFPVLARSPVRKPAAPGLRTWSIVCYYFRRDARGRGLMARITRDAVAFAKSHGAEAVEAFPVDPKPGWRPSGADGYTGLAPALRKAGFEEVARRPGARADALAMRRVLVRGRKKAVTSTHAG